MEDALRRHVPNLLFYGTKAGHPIVLCYEYECKGDDIAINHFGLFGGDSYRIPLCPRDIEHLSVKLRKSNKIWLMTVNGVPDRTIELHRRDKKVVPIVTIGGARVTLSHVVNEGYSIKVYGVGGQMEELILPKEMHPVE